jgi:hypothetical protein
MLISIKTQVQYKYVLSAIGRLVQAPAVVLLSNKCPHRRKYFLVPPAEVHFLFPVVNVDPVDFGLCVFQQCNQYVNRATVACVYCSKSSSLWVWFIETSKDV